MSGKVTFSLSKAGFNGPTPAHIARRIDISSAICGVLVTGVNSTPFPISSTVASTISWFLGLIVAILLAIKPFYSVETTEKKIPVEDVEVLETKTDKNG